MGKICCYVQVASRKRGRTLLNLKDLIEAGAVQVGDIFVWSRKNQGSTEELTVDSFGKLKSSDGKTFGSPTAAAKNFNGGVAINGWRVWKIKRTGEALDDLRKRISDLPT